MTHPRTYTASELSATGARWIKSSYSDGAGNNCVEVTDLTSTRYNGIAIRDSKRPNGPALLIPAPVFTALVDAIRR
ncbi:DUF397 domain-containing protein [Streptomyces sp. YIM S03343]